MRRAHGSVSVRPAVRILTLIASFAFSTGTALWSQSDPPLPEPPADPPSTTEAPRATWGQGEPPTAANELFATSDGCESCHRAAEGALALRDRHGYDVSPSSLWSATLHANSNRDPFYLAQLSLENAPDGGASCLPCHAPMAYHSTRLLGQPVSADDPLAHDGVSCTVCHSVTADGLAGDAAFDGHLPIGRDRVLYGPHANPVGRPMLEETGYSVAAGAHLLGSELCGSCHTQRVASARPGGVDLLLSGSFLEWRATEPADRQSCQACHFGPRGERRIARNPLGRDYNVPLRPEVSSHGLTGGNAYLLDLFVRHGDELGVEARASELERAAIATRIGLLDRTAKLSISEIDREDSTLRFDVRIENLTGHKLPTGFPSRRMWLMVEVRIGGQEVFVTGRFDELGRLVDIDENALRPHVDVVTQRTQVPVYEATPIDRTGAVTRRIHAAAAFGKDNRLLPRGWAEGSPDAAATSPVGVGADPDFRPGHDTVHFRLNVLGGTRGRAVVITRLLYQPIAPAWIAPHEAADQIASRRFARMTASTPPLPEVLGLAIRFEE